ncbi:Putative pre-16S rRNA nuclease Yqg [hydrothermal vent metagenome]|uniref:Pre-16S rRNA nuclease Yqg n=1 Tax=hydrothermal vent metagenome TaxID=652676 RepID=A0A3B0R7S6_9ZZZZ
MSNPLYLELEDLEVESGQRLLGLDLGSKTIGIALSDTLQHVATPLETLRRKKFTADAKHLLALAERFDIAAFVIGLPLNMDGSEGPRIQSTNAFVRNMAGKTDIPFISWDERMSSVAVERVLLDADSSRAARARVIDKMAAGYILQGALDRLSVIRAQRH